jgi:hypothetical protein
MNPRRLTSQKSFVSVRTNVTDSFQEKNGEHKKEQVHFVFLPSHFLMFHGLGAEQACSACPRSPS